MKKILFTSIICVMIIVLTVGCGKSEKEKQKEQLAKNDIYFNIVEEIKNGDYKKALSDIKSNYGDFDYSDGADGFNKMNLYRAYYDKQNMYDDEMNILLDFLKANNFKDILDKNTKKVTEENENIISAIHMAADIMNKVSNGKKMKL